MKRTLKDDYFEWLLASITGEKCRRDIRDSNTMFVLRSLHSYQFEVNPKCPLDYNRVKNAVCDRYYFCSDWIPSVQNEFLQTLPDKPSMLEVMIRLSKELDYISDIGEENSFWLMYDNLNLSKANTYEDVKAICDTVVNRTYDRYGNGSFFPQGRWLDAHPELNMADIQIWDQAGYYTMYSM